MKVGKEFCSHLLLCIWQHFLLVCINVFAFKCNYFSSCETSDVLGIKQNLRSSLIICWSFKSCPVSDVKGAGESPRSKAACPESRDRWPPDGPAVVERCSDLRRAYAIFQVGTVRKNWLSRSYNLLWAEVFYTDQTFISSRFRFFFKKEYYLLSQSCTDLFVFIFVWQILGKLITFLRLVTCIK